MSRKLLIIFAFIFVCAMTGVAYSSDVPAAAAVADSAAVASADSAVAPAVPASAEAEAVAAAVADTAKAAVAADTSAAKSEPTAADRKMRSEVGAMTAAASAAGAASTAAAKEAEEAAAREAARLSNTPAAKAYAEARAATPSKTIVVPSPEAKSIGAAMAAARPGDTVVVKDGVYKEVIHVTPGIMFRAANPFKAVLDGRGRNTIVTMGTGATISGFEIRNGVIGIFSASGQATIRRCRIMKQSQSGIMCVGVMPRIEDNLIVYNKGSGIQGWDVRTTGGSVNHNTIAFNTNHGISLGGNTSIIVENNIIAFNDQFGVKPGEETVRIELVNNNLYQNARISSNLPSDNISDDPLFVDAKRLNFNLRSESRSIGQGTDNQNLGARILH